MSILITSELENLILGGDFNANPWQRGISFISPSTLDYTADRFQYRASGIQTFTITKDSDNPSLIQTGLFDSFSLNAEVTTANLSPGVTDFTTIEQPIEGFMAIPVLDNFFSLSFWVKSAVAGTYCISFQNDTRTRNYIVEYTISAPDTWEEINMQVKHDTSGGTWEIGNQAGLRVIFTLNAGASFQGIPNTWQAGDLIATSNQVNLSSTLTNSFRIDLVRCYHGIIGTAYWMRDRCRELMFCQRYYTKSYDVDVTPGAINMDGAIAGYTTVASTDVTTVTESQKVSMRAIPTVTWYSPVTGIINNIANIDTATDFLVTSTMDPGENHIGYPVTSGAVPSNDIVKAHYTADAEL